MIFLKRKTYFLLLSKFAGSNSAKELTLRYFPKRSYMFEFIWCIFHSVMASWSRFSKS